jgi:hypothetical protein
VRDYQARLHRAEERAASQRRESAGPPILIVAVGDDGRGRFECDGESFQVGSRAELRGFPEDHDWQPLRVILGFDSPAVETVEESRWR